MQADFLEVSEKQANYYCISVDTSKKIEQVKLNIKISLLHV